MLKKIDHVFAGAQNWIMVLTGIAVCMLIFAGAVMRYLLKMDFYGSEEIILFAAFWLYFTGSAAAARNKTHINADMISMFVKNQKTVDTVHMIKDIFSLIMSALATYWSFHYVIWSIEMDAVSNVFKLPVVIAQIPIFLSFLLWTIYLIRDIAVSVKERKNVAVEE